MERTPVCNLENGSQRMGRYLRTIGIYERFYVSKAVRIVFCRYGGEMLDEGGNRPTDV